MNGDGSLAAVAGNQFTSAFSTGCSISAPCWDVAADRAGNLIVAAGSQILKIAPGSTSAIPAPEGSNLISIAIDANGNYIAVDNQGGRIYRISPSSPDTPQIVANIPATVHGLVRVDASGNYILALDNISLDHGSDRGSDRASLVNARSRAKLAPPPISLFQITPGATPPTCSIAMPVTGCAPVTISGGTPLGAGGLTFDASGNYVIADWFQSAIFTITPAGVSTALISADAAPFTYPSGISRDPASGYYFVADIVAGALYTFDPAGNNVSQIVSGGLLLHPSAVAVVDSAAPGSAEYVLQKNVNIVPAGGGAAIAPDVSACVGATGCDIATDAAGNLIVATGSALLCISPAGAVTTIATPAAPSQWTSVAVDQNGDYIVVDKVQSALDRVPANGGTATAIGSFPIASIDTPEDVFVRVDSQGNDIVAEDNGGSLVLYKFSGSNVPASIALTGAVPVKVGGFAFDANGNYVVTDPHSATVDVITPDGAGSVLYGNPSSALRFPTGIYRDPVSGNFVLADEARNAVYLLSPDGSLLTAMKRALSNPLGVTSVPVIPLQITTASLPAGVQGAAWPAFNQTAFNLTASGGSGNYTWNATGLPAGLTLSATGSLSGTASAPAQSSVLICVTDTASNLAVVKPFQLSLSPPLTLSLSTASIATVVGAPVSASFAAAGGAGGYLYSISGAPSGVTIGSSGALTGASSQAGTFNATVTTTDSHGDTYSTALTIDVLGFAPVSLANGTVGLFYAASLTPAGGTGPYSITATGLPAGLAITSYGYLNGTPRAAGTFPITVTVASGGLSASLNLAFTAANPLPLSVSTTSLPAGAVSALYSQGLQATGGLPPYTWAIISGALPQGLTMNTFGVVSGTPATPGTASLGVQVTDTAGGTATGVVSLPVNPAPIGVTTQSLPAGMVNVSYPSQVLSATGGVPPYTWSAANGALPSGITLSSGGILSGTPASSAATFSPAITVTDSATPPDTTTFTPSLVIRAASSNADLALTAGTLTFSLASPAAALPAAQNFGVQSTVAGQQVNYSLAASPAAAWLSVANASSTPDTVTVSLTQSALSLAAGAYQTTLTATCASASCQGHAQSLTVILNVTSAPPNLAIGTSLLSFATAAANTVPLSQSIAIQNAGGGTIGFSSLACEAAWCTAGAPPASLGGGASASIPVTVNPGLLSPGFYRTQVDTVTSAGSGSVAVTLFIAANGSMTLAPEGLQFSMPEGGAVTNPGGSFLVSVNNAGAVSWNANVLGAPGGAAPAWLVLGTASGASTSAQPGSVSFSIDPAASSALAPGAYYGRIEITSAGVNNSPQDFEVVLNVAAANSPSTSDPQPAGLLFITSAGGAAPPETVSATPGSSASAATADGNNWLLVTPGTPSGVFDVAVNTAGLSAGVYTGGVNFSAGAAGVQTVNVTMIVANQGGSSDISGPALSAAPKPAVTAHASGCTPTVLAPAQTGLVNNFSTPASWPAPLAILLANDCGAAVSNGQIVATFSNGDPPLALGLADAAQGLYSGTWSPGKTGSEVSIDVSASAPGYPTAKAQISGAVLPNAAPVLTPNGTVHSFDPLVGGALAPGTIVAIYGQNLASQAAQPSSIPLPTAVNGTSVIIGGMLAPMYYVSAGQINAQIPFELQSGQQYQVIVEANGALTTPNPIQLTAATPGLAAFATGTLIAQHGDGTLVSQTSPAVGGEYLVAYLAGMGTTNVPVASGTASPSSPLAVPNDAPTLTINGAQTPIAFAGLTPGLVGLYQMNFQVPSGLPAGNITLVVTQNGQASNQTILPYQP